MFDRSWFHGSRFKVGRSSFATSPIAGTTGKVLCLKVGDTLEQDIYSVRTPYVRSLSRPLRSHIAKNVADSVVDTISA